jgi:hypothetical protein
MQDEIIIREQTKQWATDALKFADLMALMIHAYIDPMPLTLVGMPSCLACESVLRGAYGDCHSLDLPSGPGTSHLPRLVALLTWSPFRPLPTRSDSYPHLTKVVK